MVVKDQMEKCLLLFSFCQQGKVALLLILGLVKPPFKTENSCYCCESGLFGISHLEMCLICSKVI